jgi:hypothetical protein
MLALAGCAASAPPAPAKVTITPPAVTTTSAALAFSSWYSDGGKSALGKLVAALGKAGAASPSDFPAMSAACSQVASAVTAMDDAGPIPYHPAERWIARALAEFSAGASDCQAGAQGQNVALLQKAAAEVTAGTTDLGKTTKALQAIGY